MLTHLTLKTSKIILTVIGFNVIKYGSFVRKQILLAELRMVKILSSTKTAMLVQIQFMA